MDQNREVREGGPVLFICMAHVISYRNEFCIPWSLSTSDIVSRSYVGEITQNPVQNTRPLDPPNSKNRGGWASHRAGDKP